MASRDNARGTCSPIELSPLCAAVHGNTRVGPMMVGVAKDATQSLIFVKRLLPFLTAA
eukprot:m.49268 g.49268  ORF g.49268 m.49268 type:complete len:58 (-) comp6101_c0_seq1:1344-1517(-)